MGLYRDFPGNYATSFTNTAGGNAALPSNKLFIGSTADNASGALLQVTGGVTVTGLLTQTFTGTTTNALSITADSLTTGNSFYTSTSSTSRTDTAPSTTTANNSLVASISNGANATKTAVSVGYYAYIANTGTTPRNYSFYSDSGIIRQNDATDNTLGNLGSGSIQTAGGVGIAKNLTVGTGLTLNADANLRMTSGTGYFQQVYVNSSATAAAYQANTISSTRSGAVNSVSADYNYALTVIASRTSAVSALALYDYGVNASVTGQAIASQNVYGGQFSGYIPSSTLGTIYGGLFSSSGGATSYGIYSTASGGTTNYSFYGGAGTIYNAGNVLIGTTSTDTNTNFHLSGTAQMQLGQTASTGYYHRMQMTGGNYLDIIANGDTDYRIGLSTNNGSGIIRFFTAAATTTNTERMRITGTGMVLIGRTSEINSNTRLQVDNSTGWIAGSFQGDTTTNRVVIGTLTNVATIGGHNNAQSAWAPLSINQGGGNVLIGTATDNVGKLQVSGSINPTSEVWFNPTGASKAISWGTQTAGGLNGTYSRIYDAGNLTIATDDTVEFRHITAATGAFGNVVASFTLTDTTGAFTATSKSFDIRDPRQEDEDVRLVHGSLEGPEFGVYYRGKSKLVDGVAIINLPDYFESLVDLENRTVILTPVFVSDETISQLASSEVMNGQFTVKCTDNNNLSQSFFWEAKAFRKDIPPLEVEKIRVPKVRT